MPTCWAAISPATATTPYRVANICVALSSDDPMTLHKIAMAAALHDMGSWTARTFDYLPSVGLATAHLAQAGLADWTPEITAMILEHHKITRWGGRPD